MRKSILLLFVLFISMSVFSQISQGGEPISFSSKNLIKIIDELYIEPLNMESIDYEDAQREKENLLPLIGRTINIKASLENNGTWIDLPNGGKLWRLKIYSPGAEGLIVNYDKIKLPYKSQFFLYSSDKSFVIGAFTNLEQDNGFTTQMTPGDEVILEYYQPADVFGKAEIEIKSIAYIYRQSGFNRSIDKDFGGSESCEINVNCSPEGDNAQDQKRGIVRILLTENGQQAWCSGSLINTTNNDCTPYVLTADHCGHDATTNDLTQWIFYFNYESQDCDNPTNETGLTNETLTGCSLIANGGNKGDDGSDFFLIKTSNTVPDSYNPYWNGWDRSNNGSASGYGIHHPAGDIKKISHYSTQTQSSSWGSTPDSHWKVTWSSTSNGWGVTEGGSSGSPLFNSDGKIIGDLTGGGASCSNQSNPDLYGKIWFSWDQNDVSTSTSGNQQLKPYLDPDGTAPMSINGRNACTTITTDFYANKTIAYKNEIITFYDSITTASDPITSWNWDFGGSSATPSSATTAGPINVKYNATGIYTCSLTASDGTLTDDEEKVDYIKIVDSLTADYTTANLSVTTGSSLDFTDISFGGKGTINAWNWTFNSGTPATSNIQNPTGIVWNTSGNYEIKLCVETDSAETDCITYIIHVVDLTDLQFDFTGVPTTVVVGGGVDFTDTVIANGPITAWSWSFSGADVSTSNVENPTGITWNTSGDYDVSLTASSANDTQTVTKVQYIHVIDSTELPIADFVASSTSIAPGASINYTNLTTNYNIVDSSRWILSGATAPNNDIVIFEPTSVQYLNPGYYDAKLIIYCSTFGNDTITKTDYIHVLDTNNLGEVHARFRATTSRLIKQGWSVSFETIDEEIGDAEFFEWTFEGGTPSTWTGQTPPAITYNSTEGAYDVALKVWNSAGATDSLNKIEYVIVITEWPWGDPDGFCDDELSNMKEIPHAARHLIKMPNGWGYFPGHNHLKVRYYAEKFLNYTFDKVRKVNLYTSRIYNASNNYNKVVVCVWDVDSLTGMPGKELGAKTTHISDYSQLIAYPVEFDEPVEVNEEYFVGFKLFYASGEQQDTFALYYSGHRPYGPNYVVCAKSLPHWKTPTEMLGDTLYMSLDLSIQACIIKVEDLEKYKDKISIYPNPTKGKITVDLGDIPYINPQIKVYDLTGRLINIDSYYLYGNTYKMDFGNQSTGIYFISFDFDGAIITKKLTLIK